MNHPTTRLLAAAAVAPLILLGACGSDEEGGAAGADGDKVKIAAIFSGPTNDADYNALGLQALQAAKDGWRGDLVHREGRRARHRGPAQRGRR